MKKYIIQIFAAFAIGFIISYLVSGIKNGILLSFGWSGMYLYLEKSGFPFLWQTKCPVSHERFSVPIGCMNGFNLTAFMFNVLIFAIILFLLIKLIGYLKNFLSNRF